MKTSRLRSKPKGNQIDMSPEKSDKSDVQKVVIKEGPSSDTGIEEASSVEQSKKHPVTPLKVKNKCSKSADETDVHSFCTTPKSRFGRIVLPDIPRFSDPYYLEEDKEDLPEITWDFNSPKTEKDLQDAAKSMTIAHLLANLTRFCKDDPKYQQPQNSGLTLTSDMSVQQSSSSSFVDSKLSVDKSPVTPEFRLPSQSHRKFQRRRWRRPTPEMTKEVLKILDSLSESKGGKNDTKRNDISPGNKDPQNGSCENISNTKCHLFAEDGQEIKDSDALEEFWANGIDDDDNLIVRATQEFENCLIHKVQSSPSQNTCFYIPETLPPNVESNYAVDTGFAHSSNKQESSSFKNLSSKAPETIKFIPLGSHSKKLANVQQTHVIDDLGISNWDSILDDDWCDLLDISGLSKTVDETKNSSTEKTGPFQQAKYQTQLEKSGKTNTKHTNVDSNTGYSADKHSSNKKTINIAVGDTRMFDDTKNAKNVDTSNDSKIETYDAENELFEDEGLLNDPEILQFIDKVESQSISAQKCCEEEIALKREAALKKLRKNRRYFT